MFTTKKMVANLPFTIHKMISAVFKTQEIRELLTIIITTMFMIHGTTFIAQDLDRERVCTWVLA